MDIKPELLATLGRAAIALERLELPYALVGGVGVGAWSRFRDTDDVDLVVVASSSPLEPLLAHFAEAGFSPRVSAPVAIAAASRAVLLGDDVNGLELDLSLGALPFEVEMVERAVTRDISGISVPVARPEDLAVTKIVAGRPKDWEDVAALLEHVPTFDREFVLRTIAEFADDLEMPELLVRAKSLLTV